MEWPWQYNFPPFFTLQPNEDTRRKQLDAWCDLILVYCAQKRLYQLDLVEAQNNELFNNKKIDRKCTLEMISSIVDELVRRGRAEWLSDAARSSKSSPSKTTNSAPKKCLIYWHTLDEWAKIIYDYVNRKSLQNTVCTFYELSQSSDVKNEKFYKMDPLVLKKSLQVLGKQNKAEVFQSDSQDPNSDMGVKFF